MLCFEDSSLEHRLQQPCCLHHAIFCLDAAFALTLKFKCSYLTEKYQQDKRSATFRVVLLHEAKASHYKLMPLDLKLVNKHS